LEDEAMVNQAVQQFIAAVNKSPELRAKTEKALDGSKDPAGFVAVAKEAGYKFSEDDARKYFAELLTAKPPGEITDVDLEQISGGKDTRSVKSPLNETVNMFQRMTLKITPGWTGFRF
jgi:predicted ribosomally synthesized peptide with nif11-like leader